MLLKPERFSPPFGLNQMMHSLLHFSRETAWMRTRGRNLLKTLTFSMPNIQAVLSKPIHFSKNTNWRGRGGWPSSHIHNTPGTSANLSHVISSALDLWPLPRAVFVLKARCRCLNCLSEISLEGHGSVCWRNMLLKPLVVAPPLCPACVDVSVRVCLSLSPVCFMHAAH